MERLKADQARVIADSAKLSAVSQYCMILPKQYSSALYGFFNFLSYIRNFPILQQSPSGVREGNVPARNFEADKEHLSSIKRELATRMFTFYIFSVHPLIWKDVLIETHPFNIFLFDF